MAHTIFHSRQQQLAAQTSPSDADVVRARRSAARRQVLEAFSLVPPAEQASAAVIADSTTGDTFGGRGLSPEVRGGPSNPNANAFATAAISLSAIDDMLAAANEVTANALGILGVANPVVSTLAQIAVGAGIQANAPLGSLFSSPLSNLLGFANVRTSAGLETVSTGRVAGLSREQSPTAPQGTGFGTGQSIFGPSPDVSTPTQSGVPGFTRTQSTERPGSVGAVGGVGDTGSGRGEVGGPGEAGGVGMGGGIGL